MQARDEEQLDFWGLPEEAKDWPVDRWLSWCVDTLGEAATRLSASVERERGLLIAMQAIANRARFCTYCGKPDGDLCVSPGQCNQQPADARLIAVEALKMHKEAAQAASGKPH